MVLAQRRCLLGATAFVAVLLAAPLAVPAAVARDDAAAQKDLALLDAVTWGASPASFDRLAAMGREAWLRDQLHPGTGEALPEAVAAEIARLQPAGSLFERVAAFDAQAKAAAAEIDPTRREAAQAAHQTALTEAGRASVHQAILRALYTPAQLRERMTWFWLNRFNVFIGKANVRASVGDYVDTAIRPHALGRFRDLLAATLQHPAMLRYLDNADNAAGRINENYARELMERHTMGVGSGYTQADVEQLARILTGVGISSRAEPPRLKLLMQEDLVRDGLFEFNPARHAYGPKVLLGRPIQSRGFAEVDEALDILSRHPATARNVGRALATYFVGDTPAEALVQKLAATFTRTDGDIAAVLDELFHAPEFAVAAAGGRFKDPVRFVFSALRLAYDTRVIRNPATVQSWLTRLGEGLFLRSTPDGYPLASAAWTGPGQMVTRFEVARQIGSGPANLFKPAPESEAEPAFPLLQNRLYFTVLAGTLGERTQGVLARAVSPQDWNALFLASPEFMH
ncbi:DUF1800 domain-containing protein [Chelatococcus reniformis]|uniref:DUF1800 domain-containing protein n=1 Tax=Chelatococcus reniformis TaxID=1494448 RepID=A0A916XP23_9HYPH|nr:DUF1800 domain-containing protein [Chelatococcus reniformis]GGC88159.1 hypothetical protein GCM10010994_52660 [Chelatococcus reniformis]